MFTDHENLLSTFGKDSESSQRKPKNISMGLNNKKAILFDEPKSKYEQILNQRKNQIFIGYSKDHMNNKLTHKSKQTKIKPTTENDIQYLNSRIRKSISGIAESICKSKISSKSNVSSKVTEFDPVQCSSLKKQTIPQLNRQSTHSQNKLNKNYNSKKQSTTINNKQNFDINAFKLSKYKNNNKESLNRNEYLKESTKKKTNILNYEQNCYYIKSSFSIDLNSHASSRLDSSQRRDKKNQKSNKKNEQEVQQIFTAAGGFTFQGSTFSGLNDYEKHPNPCNPKVLYKLDSEFILNKQMQDTLKKEYKLNYHEKNCSKQFQQTKGSKQHKFNQEFLFYEDHKDINKNKKNKKFIKNKQIHKLMTEPVYNQFIMPFQMQSGRFKTYHSLVQALVKQIQLDYDLRHAKHMFSGIEQPFNLISHHKNASHHLKWSRLNEQLQKIGLFYPIQTIKLLFLPTEQQIDPFLSASQPHEQLVYSLIFAYERAQINWEQTIYQKWQHWDLRDIDFTIESIDRNRKGYISVEDLTAFLGAHTGIQYKNRDLILIYRRFLSLGKGRNSDQLTETSHININHLKFRSLINSLIRPFTKTKLRSN